MFTVDDPSTEYCTCDGKPPPNGHVSIRVLLRSRNGCEHRQRTGRRSAVVHRQAGNLLKILTVADGGIFRVDDRAGISLHFNGLRRRSQLELRVRAQHLPRIQLQRGHFVIREAVGVDGKFVVSRLQVNKLERAVGIGTGVSLRAVVQIDEHELRVGHRALAGIFHDANNSAKR